MSEHHVRVTLDLYVEVDEEELLSELGSEKPKVEWSDITAAVIEQIEEAVKESGHGTSTQLSFADENTQVKRLS